MNKSIKSFLYDNFIYTFINILNKGIPFLLLPFIINIVSVGEYGKYAIYLTTEALLMPLIGASLHGAVNRHYYEKDTLDLGNYISSVVWFQLFSLIAYTLLFLIITFVCGVQTILGVSKDFMQLAILSGGSLALINILTTLYRVQRNTFKYGLFIILQSITLFSVVIVFISYKPDAYGVVYARSLVFIVFLLITLFFLQQESLFKLHYDKSLLSKALYFALPTIPHAFSAYIFVYSDRYMIQYFLKEEALGLYSAVFQVSALISVIGMSFNAAWIPWLFEHLKKKDLEVNKMIIRISYSLKVGFLFLGLFYFWLFPWIATFILNPDYESAFYLSKYFILGFVLQGLYFIVVPYIFYSEKTKYLSILSLSAASINIILNFTLMPSLGLRGAAISSCIAWSILYVFSFFISYRLVQMPWGISRV